MPYGTQAAAEAIAPKLVGLTATELNWTEVLAHIDREINMRLRGYFVVPFTTPFPEAITHVANIMYAGWAIFIRYSEDSPNNFPVNRYWDMGMELLGKIQRGTVPLETDRSTLDTTDRFADMAIKSNTEDDVPMFNLGDETDWRDPRVDGDGERIDGRFEDVEF